MNDYEVLILLDPELPEERGSEIIARVREQVDADGGTWDGHEPWGRRKLAYEIDHKSEGVYHLLLFTTPTATLAEISRVLKITDGVVRHLAVRRVKDGTTQPPAPVAAVSVPSADAAAAKDAAPEPPTPVPAVSVPAADAGTAEDAATESPTPVAAVSVPADDAGEATE